MRNSAAGPERAIRCPLLPGHPPTSLDLSNLGLSSSETGLPRASGRKWSAGRPQPLLFSLQGWAVRWGAQGGSASGRHPGRGFARRKHAERGGRAPLGTSISAKAPELPLRVPSGGWPESHMMSQTMTQAVCLILTACPNCTMSHPGHPARRSHLATSTLALRLRRHSRRLPVGQGAGGRAPRAGWRAGDVTGSGGWVTRR